MTETFTFSMSTHLSLSLFSFCYLPPSLLVLYYLCLPSPRLSITTPGDCRLHFVCVCPAVLSPLIIIVIIFAFCNRNIGKCDKRNVEKKTVITFTYSYADGGETAADRCSLTCSDFHYKNIFG